MTTKTNKHWIDILPYGFEPPGKTNILCPDCKSSLWLIKFEMAGFPIKQSYRTICLACGGIFTYFDWPNNDLVKK